jgi:outer membrane lipoprotein-sorting protein
MTHARRWPSSLAAVAVLVLAIVPLGAQAPDPVAQLFERGRAVQASMRSLSGSFVETTVSSMLRDPVVARGTVIAAVNPLRVVMRYGSPEPRTVWIDERTLAVARAGKPGVEEIGIADVQRRVQKYFTSASLSELRISFDLTLVPDSRLPSADRLEMTPKRRQIKEGLQGLRIWIDRASVLMVKMEMAFPGGDSKTIEFSDLQPNVAITEATFARPKGGR